MEMRAEEDIEIGEDITPPLFPLSFSLNDSFLSSHCSSCFSPLSSPAFPSLSPHAPLYCSAACSAAYSCIPSSSAESLLPPSSPHSSDLRTALRFLLHLPRPCPHLHRFNNGLLTNYHKLSSSPEFATQIRQGAIAMAGARKLRNRDSALNKSDGVLLEEAVLSLVLTNAVEVQDEAGRSLGIAVYDPNFSWINHSCSPNACYRFSVSPPNATSFGEDSSSSLRIVPSVSEEDSGVCSCSGYMKGTKGYEYGPKIIVRSIKRIKKGEEVCISYTDLLQPKATRQSDLWLKYQFTCSCRRCTMSPSTYVDHALEEILASNLSSSSSCFDLDHYKDEASKKLSDYVDGTITEFLSVGDPESCCMKLESVLSLGLQIEKLESGDGKSHLNFKFHPFHHIALNAYTTLASAYRIRSSDFLALDPRTDQSQFKAFDMSRISAAYSLLLAGATHHLFCLESSLIVSAANFWKHAGESLLALARNCVWNSLGLPILEQSTILKYKCSNCSLLDIYGAEFLSQAERANFENISSGFLACVRNMAPKIWRFLINGCHYLETIEDPFDFRWLAHVNCDAEQACFITEGSNFEHHAAWYTIERRIHIYKVGIHCLMYGVILAQVCYGQSSHFTTRSESWVTLCKLIRETN
ncbi:hypothetical protein like AT1G43245 [Hibiscus trionum]|uniref:SET domain-containing protein n=1 Tax=Hibiscus trionum TaxID=183268 RepID=A0A9W7LUH6_HIBTR|nr:hypothetical protein like AT1G43245 [Hibiscus trionum]